MRHFLLLLVLLSSLSLSAATFTVTTTADGGPGSLRQAIVDVNAYRCVVEDPCRIVFAIPAPVPATGWFTIAPQSPLPVISKYYLTIDGFSQAELTGDTNPLGPEIELDGTSAGYRSGLKAYGSFRLTITGLTINRFEGHGIFIESSSNASVRTNYVGVDPTGARPLPNGFNGIALRDVRSSQLYGNIVSGNRSNGFYFSGCTDVSVTNNRIGVGRTGEEPIPNGASGIDASGSRLHVSDNVVAFNALHGIAVRGDVAVLRNDVFGNGLLAIANWDTGAPEAERQEAPVITTAIEDSSTRGFYTGFPAIRGTVRSTPDTTVLVAAYAAPAVNSLGRSDARQYLGSVSVKTDASGKASFEIQRDYYGDPVLDVFGGFVAASAQREGVATSVLSDPVPIDLTTRTFEVTTTADAVTGSLREAVERANASVCAVEAACRIAFNVPSEQLTDGAARIQLASPLPPLRGYIRMSGASQAWWHGDTNAAGPEVEIRGGDGLHFGTAAEPVTRAYVHQLAINGSSGDGLTIMTSGERVDISQPLIVVDEIFSGTDARGESAVPNAGSGLRIVGGVAPQGLGRVNVRVSDSLLSGNRQHGLVLGGEAHLVERTLIGTDLSGTGPLPNGDDGVHAIGGTRHQLIGNVIAFNGDSGVATDPGVRVPAVHSSVHRNGRLGIDVNDDGVTPADGNLEDGTIDPPAIQRVSYDAAADVTIIEGTTHPYASPFGAPPFGGEGERFGNSVFMNSEPDPSGRGEGERPYDWTYPPIKFVEGANGTFRIGIMGDLRGNWFSATTNRYYCYWEFGCTAREASEFSNAVKAE